MNKKLMLIGVSILTSSIASVAPAKAECPEDTKTALICNSAKSLYEVCSTGRDGNLSYSVRKNGAAFSRKKGIESDAYDNTWFVEGKTKKGAKFTLSIQNRSEGSEKSDTQEPNGKLELSSAKTATPLRCSWVK